MFKNKNFQIRFLSEESTCAGIFASNIFWIVIILILTSSFEDGFTQDQFQKMIRQVQINSQNSYDEINSVRFEGKSKSYIYFAYSPFEIKMIPFLEEYYFDGFWMKPDSIRIVIMAQRIVKPDSEKVKRGDIFPLPNPFHYLYDPSAIGLRDSSENNSIPWPLYPFSLGADSLYNYQKINEIGFDTNKVILIKTWPKDTNIPAVIGTFMIDANKNVVVGSDVIFNEAASLSRASVDKDKNSFSLNVTGSEQHKIITKKALLYGSYWLPTSIEEEFQIRILGIKAKIHRIIDFEAYYVNYELPDTSIFPNEKIVYRPDSILQNKMLSEIPFPDKLTKEEEDQIIQEIEDKLSPLSVYSEILESESMASEIFKMSIGQRMGKYFNVAEQIGNYTLYNRIEGLRLGYGMNFTNIFLKNTTIGFDGGYGFKDKRWKGRISSVYAINKNKFFIEGNIFSSTGYEESKQQISSFVNSFTSLLYKGDYRDYYYKKGGNIGVGFSPQANIAFKISFLSQSETNSDNNTKFSLFNYSKPFRLNPQIIEGRNNSITGLAVYNSYKTTLSFAFEYTDTNNLKSDFSYSLMKAHFKKEFRITLNSNLYLNGNFGYSAGKLVPQRWFDFGGRSFLNYHGNLRGLEYKEFTGDKMASGTVEYALKGNSLYDKGLNKKFIRALKLNLWSGFGWSALKNENLNLARGLNIPTHTTDGSYYEFGIGIGDLFNIFRIDFIHSNYNDKSIKVQFNMLQ